MKLPSSETPVNQIEICAYGLQRSGNHAILLWVIAQHAGKTACLLNNVRHGEADPYKTCVQREVHGLDESIATDSLREHEKQLLIYTYEDDLSQMGEESDFLKSALSPEFNAAREHYLMPSRERFEFLIIRDPFNFFASRLKKLNQLSGEKDLAVIVGNWKKMARRALEFMENPSPGRIVGNYNRWVNDQSYREELSRQLHGTFNDASMGQISYYGGGSSFDATNEKLGARQILKNWRKIFEPARYKRIGHYYRRLIAPEAKDMKVNERWRQMAGDKVYKSIFADPELIELSEQIFGEIPGTRDFVRTCLNR